MSRRHKIAIQALMGIALLFCIGATLTFLHARIYTILDADEASELVLAKLLSEDCRYAEIVEKTDIPALLSKIPPEVLEELQRTGRNKSRER